jgi:hypothetical protein
MDSNDDKSRNGDDKENEDQAKLAFSEVVGLHRA